MSKSEGDFCGGWNSDVYASIKEINNRDRDFIPPNCVEYELRMKISELTLENVKLRVENENLFCENGRLTRTIERRELGCK